MTPPEFSYETRQQNLQRFRDQSFDLLVVGGGINGVAAARDAATRGLRVALVEKGDFASGTSSRSSRLIHGGLRYLEHGELALVFEALAERTLLLRNAPHLVRPLRFYFPVYRGDPHGMLLLGLGMWLYDLLALYRSPGFHRPVTPRGMARAAPGLVREGLRGGFRYYDASMWDDVLTVEIARAASRAGAVLANYVEATEPIWEDGRIAGFCTRDRAGDLASSAGNGAEGVVRARKIVICAGPWTDILGARLSEHWIPWLTPSKGVHLVFPWERLPLEGALVMSHPADGRIVFAMPRRDVGAGVTVVGTTDGPCGPDPAAAPVEPADVEYLLALLRRYLPAAGIGAEEIVSAYAGVRPLAGGPGVTAWRGEPGGALALQRVSREHVIGEGPGGVVFVAGGKYTTHRRIAQQAVEFTLARWRVEARSGGEPRLPRIRPSATRQPPNPTALPAAVQRARRHGGESVPAALFDRYGAEALEIAALSAQAGESETLADPDGFPCLTAQLRWQIRNGMVVRLEDFVLRRTPLYLSRRDHGEPWLETLAETWAEELGLGPEAALKEGLSLRRSLQACDAWRVR